VRTSRWRVSIKKPRTKDGANWLIRIRPPVGSGAKEQVRSSGTTDRNAAEEQARNLQAKLNSELEVFDTAHTQKDATFEDVFRAHVAYREVDGETAPNTRDKYRSLIKTFSALPLWKILASDVDRVAVMRARDLLVARKLEASTINVYLSFAKKAWGWGYERGLVKHAWPTIKPLKSKPTKKRPLTDGEVALVLSALKTYKGGYWYPFFSLQADTGSRIGGVLKLRGRDVDYMLGTVTYRNKGKVYSVPVPAETMALLPRVSGDQLVFPGQRFGKLMVPAVPCAAFKEALALTKILDQDLLTPHSFRRRAVATNLRSNVSLPLSMKFLGHSTAKVHLEYQRNAVGDDLREVSRNLFERRHPSQDPPQRGRESSPQLIAPSTQQPVASSWA